jgi:hypothetical protein
MRQTRRRFLAAAGAAGGAALVWRLGFDGGMVNSGPSGDVSPTPDGPRQQVAKLVAADGDTQVGDNFGSSVAVSGDGTTAIVGAERDDTPGGENAGSAYVFERAGRDWRQRAKLTAADGDGEDFLGSAVSVSDDGGTAIVGAEGDEDVDDDLAGSAYVFERVGGEWRQQAKLTAGAGDRGNDFGDRFGDAVAISGDGTTAVVGSFRDDSGDRREQGSADVYERLSDDWSWRTTLDPDDGDSRDNFGSAVSVSDDGNTVVVGAEGDEDPNGADAGSAYVFELAVGSWRQWTKLTADDGDDEDSFGNAVSISGDGTTIVVGARGDEDPNGEDGGSAYAFERVGREWSQRAKLTANGGDDSGFGDAFGTAVAVTDDGRAAVVGAEREDSRNRNRAGAAYLFRDVDEGWTRWRRLLPDDGDGDDFFGNAVAVSGDGATAVIGARRDEDPNFRGAGSAYVFVAHNSRATER